MANLSDETKKIVPVDAEEVAPNMTGGVPADIPIENMTTPELRDAIKKTTGIDLTSEMIYRNPEEEAMGSMPASYESVDAAEEQSGEDDVVKSELPGVGSMMSAEDAAKLGYDGPEEVINPDDAYKEAIAKKTRQIREAEAAGYKAMEDLALASEEDRLARLEATLALPDDHPDKIKLMESRRAMDRQITVEEGTLTAKDRRESDATLEGVTGYDPEDLMPSYSLTDEDEDAETPKAEEKKDPAPGDDAYGEFVRTLPVTVFTPTMKPVITTKREPTVSTVASDWEKKKKAQPLGDQAFANAVAKFKKNHFGVKTVPLVNSGFYVDIVGSGVVDMQNMYLNVDPRTKMYDYQMEQMRVLIQNIVGATPKIDPNVLRDKIHYADFQMIAYGHICATLDKVESVANCTECGKAFRVNGKPEELLLNMDELYERAMQIQQADSIDDYSLLTAYRKITCDNGIIITLGHPSYANELGLLNSFTAYYNRMPKMEADRFQSLLRTLYMVRKIVLPNGIQTNSLYQTYEAIKLITQEDLELVQHECSKMQKEILRPKFGIREAVCPHCGKIVKNIESESMLDMLFLHTQLSGLLNEKTDQ